MKSPLLGLRTCIYRVSDLEAAKTWYAQAFQTEPYFDEPFYVGFNIGGFELGLQPEENGETAKGKNVETYWGVEDIEKNFKRLLELGAEVNEAPKNVGGELMVATLFDPWKNLIGLIYNPYFKVPNQA